MSRLYSKTYTCHSAAVADANGTVVDCSEMPGVAFQISGTLTSVVLYFEATMDGTNWVAVRAKNVATGAIATSSTGAGIFVCDCTGLSQIRCRLDWTTGSVNVYARALSAAPGMGLAVNTLGANSGVDIGDVDVASLPGAVQGPGNPTIDSYAHAVVNLAASGANQVLVAAPGANKQIWVYGLFMMADTAAGTVTLQDEDDTALSGTMAVSDEGGWVLPMSGNFAMPWLKVVTNKALEADTGACTVDGVLTYAVVSV